jgi:anti-sigma factor RsiW
MMYCHQIVELLSSYLDEDLDTETMSHMDAHLSDCPPCVFYVDTFRRMIAASGQIPTIETIPNELRERLHSFLIQRTHPKP